MSHPEYYIALKDSVRDRCEAIIEFLRNSWFIILTVMACETLFPKDSQTHLELTTVNFRLLYRKDWFF